jgi:hypothetical protein
MKLFEWQQEFDGSQPQVEEDEQRTVARRFGGFVYDVLRKEAFTKGRATEEAIQWRKIAPPDGVENDTTRISLDFRDRRLGSPQIYMHRLLSGRPRLTVSSTYTQDQDGIVRRTDQGGDLQQEILRGRSSILTEIADTLPVDFELTEATFDQILRIAESRAQQAADNRHLAEDMGRNNQPIGIRETEALIGMVSIAKVL